MNLDAIKRTAWRELERKDSPEVAKFILAVATCKKWRPAQLVLIIDSAFSTGSIPKRFVGKTGDLNKLGEACERWLINKRSGFLTVRNNFASAFSANAIRFKDVSAIALSNLKLHDDSGRSHQDLGREQRELKNLQKRIQNRITTIDAVLKAKRKK